MTALIVVDLQNDFLPNGALEVKGGDEILFHVNHLLEMPFTKKLATKDWHPLHHCSFASTHQKKVGEKIYLEGISQILWPDHCVQGTLGAEFCSAWNHKQIQHIFFKGTEHHIDSYSAFFDNGHRKSTDLDTYLRNHHIKKIFIAGLTTDYCVKYTVLDALQLGFQTYVVKDACKAVNLHPDDENQALDEMRKAGAQIITLNQVPKYLSGGSEC